MDFPLRRRGSVHFDPPFVLCQLHSPFFRSVRFPATILATQLGFLIPV